MHRFWFLPIVVVMLASCAKQDPPPPEVNDVPGSSLPSAYQETECGFDVSRMPNIWITCGQLTVPEVRDSETSLSQPGANTVTMGVAVLHSPNQGQKEAPVLFLLTTPSPQVNWSPALGFFFSDLLADRDLIAVDVRGVGHSRPVLECPGAENLFYQQLEIAPYAAEAVQQTTDAYKACYQSWLSEGINLEAYHTEAIIGDLEELRLALGYPKWSVYAAGYGTTLAYGLLRDHSTSLSGVVLDGVDPLSPEAYLDQGANYQRTIDRFFAACSNDEQCSQAFPDLNTAFYHLVDDLNTSPHVIEVADLQAGVRRTVLLNGDRLLEFVVIAYASNNNRLMAQLPRAIDRARSGDYADVGALLGEMIPFMGQPGTGLMRLIQCREVAAQIPDVRRWQAIQGLNLQWSGYFEKDFQMQEEMCAIYAPDPTAAQPRVFTPPESSVPALILFTQDYPWSSPAWAAAAASKLSRAQVIEIQSGGNSAWFDMQANCARTLGTAFLRDEASGVDTTCANQSKSVPWVTLR